MHTRVHAVNADRSVYVCVRCDISDSIINKTSAVNSKYEYWNM
jgi:hypothetical protein